MLEIGRFPFQDNIYIEHCQEKSESLYNQNIIYHFIVIHEQSIVIIMIVYFILTIIIIIQIHELYIYIVYDYINQHIKDYLYQ